MSNWIGKVTRSIKRRGTEGVCTGSKFGSSSCPPGSRRYNLAKTFKKMAKNRKKKQLGGSSYGTVPYNFFYGMQSPMMYDMQRALELGYRPDNLGHWPSNDFVTGRILKGQNHKTYDKAVKADNRLGYRHFSTPTGTYSTPDGINLQYYDQLSNNPLVTQPMNTLFRKQYQSGGVYQTKGDPWEYKHDNGKWTTRKIGNKSWLKLPDKAVDVVTKRYLSDTTSKPNPIVQQPLYIAPMGNDIPQTYGTLLDPVTVMAPRAINTPVAPIIPAATDSYLSNPLYRQQRRAEIDLTGPVNLKPDINKLSNYNSSIDYKGELINFIRKSRKQLRSSYNNLSNMTSQDFDKFDRRTEDDVAYIKNLSNEQAFNALKATKYNENYPRSYSHGGKLYRGCTSCDKKKYQLAGGIRNIFGSIKDYFSPDPNYQAIPSDDVLPISSSDPQMKFAVPAGTVLTDEGDPNYIYPTTGVTLPEVVVTSERTPTGKVRQCDESGCAEYTIAQLERNEAPFSGRAFNPRPELSEHQPTVPMAVASAVSPFRERTGISGDAWNIYGNIIDYGGKNIYNRFPESAHHTNKSFKSDELQVGDVIGLWNRDLSPELEAEGLPRKYGVKNTHVGFVSHIEPDGSRLVEHNVYGNVYRHKI